MLFWKHDQGKSAQQDCGVMLVCDSTLFVPHRNACAFLFYLIQSCQYIQLWMPLLKHWWRMPWIVINIVTCRIPWINWILNMDCAAGVAFASIPSAYTHYCARCLCLWIAKLCWWCIWQASLMIRWRAHHKRSVCFCQRLLCRVGQSYGFVIQQLWCRWKDSLNLSI